MINKIMSASFLNNYIICAQFANGTTKKYDLKPLFKELKQFNKLKELHLLIAVGHATCQRRAIVREQLSGEL